MALDAVQEAARAQFDRQSRNYGSGHILADVSDVEAALKHLALPAVAQVLDVACGAGHTGLHLASLGHRVTCADIAASMLERVGEAAAERGLQVETRQHSAEEMPHEASAFDLVTCRIAPHHFSSPRDFVREASRVLRPGGYFLLIDGTVPDGDPEVEAWMHAVEKWRDPSHARLLPPAEWRSLCADAGLEVRHVDMRPLKQPDLEWYFQAASTPPENRAEVLALVDNASQHVREVLRLATEEGRIVWWWPRLTLVAQRPFST